MALRKLRDQDSTTWQRTLDGGVMVPLTQGFFATVDEADVARVEERLWCVMRSRNTNYAATGSPSGTILLHRFLIGKSGMEVDHRDGDGLNNRRANIREATTVQNMHNSKKFKDRPYKGVYYRPEYDKFLSRIKVEGKILYGVIRKTAKEAALDYDIMALHYWGEFAWLNFPEEARAVLRDKGVAALAGRHPVAKLTADSVRLIREQYKNGKSLTQLASVYNVSFANIGKVCRRETWKHVL